MWFVLKWCESTKGFRLGLGDNLNSYKEIYSYLQLFQL